MLKEECLFCKMIKGEIPTHTIWENETHKAFLTIYPNMKGFSVVIPKKHHPSKIESLTEEEYINLWLAAKEAAQQLTKTLGVERTAMVAEGTGVDHAHVKLIPLIGTTPQEPWSGGEAHNTVTFKKYEGYISTREGPRAEDDALATLAKKIREA